MKIKLKDGFSVNVEDGKVDDWEFLVKLRKIDKGDAAIIVDVAEMLLGGESEVEKLADCISLIKSEVDSAVEHQRENNFDDYFLGKIIGYVLIFIFLLLMFIIK